MRLLRNAIFILASSASTAHSIQTRAATDGLSPSVPDKCKNNGGFTRIPRMPVCQTDAPSFCYVSNMTPKLTRGPWWDYPPRSPDPCHAMPWHPHDFYIALNVHAQRRRMTFFHTAVQRGQRPSRSSLLLLLEDAESHFACISRLASSRGADQKKILVNCCARMEAS